MARNQNGATAVTTPVLVVSQPNPSAEFAGGIHVFTDVTCTKIPTPPAVYVLVPHGREWNPTPGSGRLTSRFSTDVGGGRRARHKRCGAVISANTVSSAARYVSTSFARTLRT